MLVQYHYLSRISTNLFSFVDLIFSFKQTVIAFFIKLRRLRDTTEFDCH